MNKNVKILLAPTKEIAEIVSADATVEAEYGDYCAEGKYVTLAHHGNRSFNPAPCNTKVEPLDLSAPKTILVSHIDLDTLGGIMALLNEKPDCPSFWKSAEKVDVKGVQHIHEVPVRDKEMMDAFHAWDTKQSKTRYTELTDVSKLVFEKIKILKIICDKKHSKHKDLILEGIKWSQEKEAEIEGKLIYENECLRVFKTDGIFCSASYYSPKQNKVIPASLVYNDTLKIITLAFEDGGKKYDACKIVQTLFGQLAGGRAGIAGSPRGEEIAYEEFVKTFHAVSDLLTGKIQLKDIKQIK